MGRGKGLGDHGRGRRDESVEAEAISKPRRQTQGAASVDDRFVHTFGRGGGRWSEGPTYALALCMPHASLQTRSPCDVHLILFFFDWYGLPSGQACCP